MKRDPADTEYLAGTPARRMRALILKESLQVVRDPSSILIAFVLPLLLLFLYGYGLSLDADDLQVGLVMEHATPESESLAHAFVQSPFFEVRMATNRQELEAEIASGRLRGMIVIPATFSQDLRNVDTSTPLQIITDGSEPNTAGLLQNYASGVWLAWLDQQAREQGIAIRPPIETIPRVWYNPELRSRNFLVPGSIAIIMTIIGVLLTSLVIAREWERGTMEAMMATPVGIVEILAGKLIPYFILGMGAMAVCVVTAVTVFAVPLRGSLLALILVSSVFLLAALGQGLLISSATRNQFVAAQAALISGFLPAVLLSGFIFEISSMPWPIQWLTRIVAARYLVTSMQTIFLVGDVWALLIPNLLAMAAIALFFFVMTGRMTVKRLD
jgi:ABC-2 type transport system permease protein